MPAEFSLIEPFASHGLHGIPEDRFDMADFCEHTQAKSRSLDETGFYLSN
jgi:hypothetical protein